LVPTGALSATGFEKPLCQRHKVHELFVLIDLNPKETVREGLQSSLRAEIFLIVHELQIVDDVFVLGKRVKGFISPRFFFAVHLFV
jgi:hypothetical protein